MDVEYIDGNKSQWVESIALPTYPYHKGYRSNRYTTLQRNYAFIKHMMISMEIAPQDYLIVRDLDNTSKITVMFNNNSKGMSSMAVILWGKYKDAKLESNL